MTGRIPKGLAWPAAALALAWAPHGAQAALAGAVMGQGDGAVTLHVRDALRPGQWVALQYMTETDQLTCCLRIRAERFKLVARASRNSEELVSGRAARAYRHVASGSPLNSAPYAGMAVVFKQSLTAVRSTSSTLSATVDGQPFSAWLCTSSEGIHVLQGPQAKPVQRIYVALHYTLESPTCPQR